MHGPGELIAWSRILDDENPFPIVNGHGTEARGGDVLVDATLNPLGSEMQVLLNTAQAGNPEGYGGGYSVGTFVPVRRTVQGIAYVEIGICRNLKCWLFRTRRIDYNNSPWQCLLARDDTCADFGKNVDPGSFNFRADALMEAILPRKWVQIMEGRWRQSTRTVT